MIDVDRAWPTHLATPEALVDGSVAIEGEAYRHLFRARRLAVGDPVRVVDGAGRARRGEVVAVDRKTARLALHDELPSREPAVEVELLVGAPRPERASWLVEKATELGVAAVRFIATARTPRSFGAKRLERLERVARAAVEQCGRARLPTLDGVHGWDEIEALLDPSNDDLRRFVLDPDTGAALVDPIAGGRALVCIGPEGGFEPSEIDALRALGCRPLGLGPRILRVETAALAAASLLLLPSPRNASRAADKLCRP